MTLGGGTWKPSGVNTGKRSKVQEDQLGLGSPSAMLCKF